MSLRLVRAVAKAERSDDLHIGRLMVLLDAGSRGPTSPWERRTSWAGFGGRASYRSSHTPSGTTAVRRIPCVPGGMQGRSFRLTPPCSSREAR